MKMQPLHKMQMNCATLGGGAVAVWCGVVSGQLLFHVRMCEHECTSPQSCVCEMHCMSEISSSVPLASVLQISHLLAVTKYDTKINIID